jgi:hypothetical protein
MNIELAIRNRLLVCALILMLAPFGISLPTFARASRAEESVQVKTAVGGDSIRAVRSEDLPQRVREVSIEPTYGTLYTGGTVALHDTLWDLRPSDGRATRPYVRPDSP